jgi:2-oxoglutarate ferredoxin oxidoreductase subunit alpha
VTNDFVIKVGTVNGSGSQTANMVLLRSLFQMGISCSGKNVFPSNIAGLPTWFEIRLSPKGYVARRRGVDFLVAMNPASAAQDLAEVLPGGGTTSRSTPFPSGSSSRPPAPSRSCGGS